MKTILRKKVWNTGPKTIKDKQELDERSFATSESLNEVKNEKTRDVPF